MRARCCVGGRRCGVRDQVDSVVCVCDLVFFRAPGLECGRGGDAHSWTSCRGTDSTGLRG
eukprot:1922326-Prymnesium_polylepis.1